MTTTGLLAATTEIKVGLEAGDTSKSELVLLTMGQRLREGRRTMVTRFFLREEVGSERSK